VTGSCEKVAAKKLAACKPALFSSLLAFATRRFRGRNRLPEQLQNCRIISPFAYIIAVLQKDGIMSYIVRMRFNLGRTGRIEFGSEGVPPHVLLRGHFRAQIGLSAQANKRPIQSNFLIAPPPPVSERGRNKRRGLPPALISIGRFWQEMQICPQIGTHPIVTANAPRITNHRGRKDTKNTKKNV